MGKEVHAQWLVYRYFIRYQSQINLLRIKQNIFQYLICINPIYYFGWRSKLGDRKWILAYIGKSVIYMYLVQNVERYLVYKSVPNTAVYYEYVVMYGWNDTGVCLVLLRSLRHDNAHLWCASASLKWSVHLHIGVTVYRKGPKWTGPDRNGLSKVETEFI